MCFNEDTVYEYLFIFSGFTPDVKVWEVCFNKNNTFHEVRRAFELKGHSAGVYSFSFNNDSTRYTLHPLHASLKKLFKSV